MQTPHVTAQYYGDSGGSTTYYYWVQAIYTWGRSPMSPPAEVTVLSISHSNVVSLSWGNLPGAIGFDILRTTSNTPPSGTDNFAIAIGLATADGFVDNGIPAFTYTVKPEGPETVEQAKEAEKSGKAAQEKLNKEIEEAIKKYEKEYEEQAKVDAEQVEKARKANELYNAGVKLKLHSGPKTPADQAKSQLPPPNKDTQHFPKGEKEKEVLHK